VEVFDVGFCCVNVMHVGTMTTTDQVVESLQRGILSGKPIIDGLVEFSSCYSMRSENARFGELFSVLERVGQNFRRETEVAPSGCRLGSLRE
jgi:hypothetical protein